MGTWEFDAAAADVGAAPHAPLALVADDEPLVRQLVCSVLARHGWRTIEATDGVAALGQCATADLDLLITDQEMPAITGLELAGAISRRLPGLPILVISGQSWVGAVARNHGYHFLQKPFGLDELMSQVAIVTGRQVDGSNGARMEIEDSAAGGVAP
jgi:CheY-like chemotaxis protein